MPPSHEDGPRPEQGDELIAQIIPLRKRASGSTRWDAQGSGASEEPVSPRHSRPTQRSVWDSPGADLPRRKAVGSEPRPGRRGGSHLRWRGGKWAALAPALALGAGVVVVLLVSGNHGERQPQRSVTAPIAGTSAPVSIAPARRSSGPRSSQRRPVRVASRRPRAVTIAKLATARHAGVGAASHVVTPTAPEVSSAAAPAAVEPSEQAPTSRQPGGFSYLGVPAREEATAQAAKAASSSAESTGGPFSP